MKEQNITFNLDGGESAPLPERGSLVGEQVDCDPDLQDVVDLVNATSPNLLDIYLLLSSRSSSPSCCCFHQNIAFHVPCCCPQYDLLHLDGVTEVFAKNNRVTNSDKHKYK